ncbi:hypothetical protein LNP04_01410 [Chryseobacterium sp. C-71]|uniref:hypothetical protein n=1 Tax=Chryseobacterium sp. C-71 TaxID=2893882 RepID=UPI001E5A2F71|nr:hypothetical protein [Chryseobacterium sp. C-71]UFH32392.1 hypothetical protein LNP04_01410 [Chryseobacterium sp. C-71]
MEITQLNLNSDKINNQKLTSIYAQFEELLEKIKQKKISEQTINFINREIDQANSTALRDTALFKLLKDKQNIIIKHLEKEYKIVPKNYYRNLWLAIGMTAFGLPIGTLFGIISGNMGLLAIGLPIGLGIGVAAGTSMDKKALQEGRQLDIEIKY